MTKIVAITGGIGSGKTTISKYLKKNNFAVHESDSTVSQIYIKPNKLFLSFLKKNVSKEVVTRNKIDKQKIAEIIFNDKKIKHIEFLKLSSNKILVILVSSDGNVQNKVLFYDKKCQNNKFKSFILLRLLS